MPDTRPYIVGVSHRDAPASIRDRIYVEEGAQTAFLNQARDRALGNAMILATCDRIEFLGLSDMPEQDCKTAETLLAERAGMDRNDLARSAHRYFDEDAVTHLFRIACALDSQMVGESQILGQLKDAVSQAVADDRENGELERLASQAFQIAKRVRGSTRIGEGAVSVAAAAVKLAERLHGEPSRLRVLVVGLGETGSLLAEQFRRAGVPHVELTGPARRTEREAARRGWHFRPSDSLADALPHTDVVITAASTGRVLISRDIVADALAHRRRRPILFFDCGVPADIDPAVDGIEEAFLYTLEDVERLAEKGQLDRHAEAREAEAMVEAAVSDWRRLRAEREGVPGLVALRDHFDRVRRDILDRHPNADAAEATRLLTNRLLHEPSEALREIAKMGEAADLKDTVTVNRVLERLFGLGPGPENSEE